MPPSLPAVSLAGDCVPQETARRLRSGGWTRSKRGVYVPADAVAERRSAALARIASVHASLGAPHVFSHGSAALLWGLPLWVVPDTTDVYQRNHPGRGSDPLVRRHAAPLADRAVTALHGVPVTTLERTVVDCARTMRPLAAMVVADAGLRAGASPDRLTELLDQSRGAAGTARARAVIEVADGGAESPWETATRFVLLADGLPRPATQVPVVTHLGTFWADIGWEDWHLLMEYDGRSKYAGIEDLTREKRRHDAIVETGRRVLRVTKEDVRAQQAMLRRIADLLPADIPRVRRPHLRSR